MPLSNTIEKTNTVATRSLRIRLSLCADHFRWTRPRRRGLGHPTLEAELRPLSIGKRTPKWVYWQSDSLYSTSVPHRGTQRVGMTNVQAFWNESGVLRSPTALRPGPFLESMTCCCRVVVTNLCVLVLPRRCLLASNATSPSAASRGSFGDRGSARRSSRSPCGKRLANHCSGDR